MFVLKKPTRTISRRYFTLVRQLLGTTPDSFITITTGVQCRWKSLVSSVDEQKDPVSNVDEYMARCPVQMNKDTVASVDEENAGF